MEQQEGGATVTQTLDEGLSKEVTIKIDSCHSTWHFEPGGMRFRRVPKGIGSADATNEWHRYHGLHFDFESAFDGFTVILDKAGTQRLRSWCHSAGRDVCEHCSHGWAEEISIEGGSQLVDR